MTLPSVLPQLFRPMVLARKTYSLSNLTIKHPTVVFCFPLWSFSVPHSWAFQNSHSIDVLTLSKSPTTHTPHPHFPSFQLKFHYYYLFFFLRHALYRTSLNSVYKLALAVSVPQTHTQGDQKPSYISSWGGQKKGPWWHTIQNFLKKSIKVKIFKNFDYLIYTKAMPDPCVDLTED